MGIAIFGIATGNVPLAILGISLFASVALAPDALGNNLPRGTRSRTTVREAVSPAQWVVGRARVGGALVFQAAQGEYVNNGAILQQVIVLSEGPVEGIEGIWLNGENVGFRFADPTVSGIVPYTDQNNPLTREFIIPRPIRGTRSAVENLLLPEWTPARTGSAGL